LLTTLKVHSAFNKFFNQPSYTVDITSYADMLFYINSMHPKFIGYITEQELAGTPNEGYIFLNKELTILTNDDLFMTKARDGDTIHLVPAIIGGGGKRGGIIAMIMIVGLAFATGGGSLAAGGVGGAGGGSSIFGGIFNTFKALPAFAKNLVTSVGLSILTRAFQKQPSQGQAAASESEAIRENGAFGPLTNSTSSGTPVPLHYGMPRVSGQFLSGYIDSTEHGKNDVVKVGDKF
jgi:predicted phage tail protein